MVGRRECGGAAGAVERAGVEGNEVAAGSELSKLAELKSQGVLTDAEFEAQKAKILSTS